MKQLNKTLISAVLACTGFMTMAALADENKVNGNAIFQLDSVTCWEVLTLPEQDSTFAMLLLYGYHAGSNVQPIQSGDVIKKALATMGDVCGDNPDMPAIQAFLARSEAVAE